jgi:NTE family protein
MSARALVLTGGGARGAYQVGALRAIFAIAQDRRLPCAFPLLTGVSAGAINAAYLAAFHDDFADAVERLAAFWRGLHSGAVFRTDAASIGKIGWGWLADAAGGSAFGGHRALARACASRFQMMTA